MQAYGNAFFGQGSGLIGVGNTNCIGNETDVTLCGYTLYPTDCTHQQDAGVRCSGEIGPCEGAGHLTCCTGGCNVDGCYCDAACHVFGDCCSDAFNKTCPQGTITHAVAISLMLA